jgi:hypothetical protein
MSRLLPIALAVLTVVTIASVLTVALVWQPWDSDGSTASTNPSMTVEGVISLVSRAHAGCPDQPLLVLSANAVYEGDNLWRVTYRDYEWTVDESEQSVEAVGEPLPCPRR